MYRAALESLAAAQVALREAIQGLRELAEKQGGVERESSEAMAARLEGEEAKLADEAERLSARAGPAPEKHGEGDEGIPPRVAGRRAAGPASGAGADPFGHGALGRKHGIDEE